jgi:hypothetical protein
MRSKATERRTTADEYAITVSLWPTTPQISDKGIAHFLSQWQTRLAPALPANVEPRVLPVDITETQLDDISCAKPEACE